MPAFKKLRASLPLDSSLHPDRDGHTQAHRSWELGLVDRVSWVHSFAYRADQAKPAHQILAKDAIGYPYAPAAFQVVPES